MISLLLAACGSTTPTRPITTATATLPVITLAPTATPAATEVPATCRPQDANTTATLDIRTTAGLQALELGPIDELATLPPAPTAGAPRPTADPDLFVEATLLGATDIDVGISIDSTFEGDLGMITALTAEFVPIGAAVAVQVEVEIDRGAVTIRLPDMDATGSLRATASWTTSCGTGEGAGAITVTLLDSSVAAGCPTTSDGLLAQVMALQATKVAYDTLQVPIGAYGWSGRWVPGEAVDDFPQFSGWDRDAALVVAPRASIVLRESTEDLSLLSVRAGIYLRAEVEAYIEPGSSTELNVFDVQRRSAGPLGRIGIPAPLEPGRYVFEVQGDAQTACLNLDTYQVISVEVR